MTKAQIWGAPVCYYGIFSILTINILKIQMPKHQRIDTTIILESWKKSFLFSSKLCAKYDRKLIENTICDYCWSFYKKLTLIQKRRNLNEDSLFILFTELPIICNKYELFQLRRGYVCNFTVSLGGLENFSHYTRKEKWFG